MRSRRELAFLSDRDDAGAKQPKWKLYRWDRQSPAAAELVSDATPGLPPEFAISDKGNLSFSKDGTRLFFGVRRRPREEARCAADASADDKAVVDLWSYKDDYIQPIQKVRAARDRDRTFTAAYLIPEHKLVQLADAELETRDAFGERRSGCWAPTIARTAGMQDYDERYSDAYLVDGATGARKLISTKSARTAELGRPPAAICCPSTARIGTPSRCPTARRST